MSILDFGVNVDGYTSDVTMTFIGGSTTELQERMIGLVEEAYRVSSSMVKPGVGTLEIAKEVDEIFAGEGFQMPHALGHGVGLQVHEAPGIRLKEKSNVVLETGMVFTLEPGLYHPEAGGVRLENDFLVTPDGSEVLTTSRIVRHPGPESPRSNPPL
jgi:Xaa-Pro dipeptidase